MCASAYSTARAERIDSTISLGSAAHLWSERLSEDRRVFVSLPASYGRTSWHYPVIYLLDGEVQFQPAAASIADLARNERIPEMIVVGIANIDRNRDMAPSSGPPRSNGQPVAGRADEFLDFIVAELRPWLANRYRCSAYSLVAGHSDGGLFVLHALMTRPESFQAFVAISPSHGTALSQRAAAAVRGLAPPHYLFLAAADHEPRIRPATELITAALRSSPPAIRWEYRHYPGENHRTIVQPALHDALNSLFAGYFPDDLVPPQQMTIGIDVAQLSTHYAELSRRLGLQLQVPNGAFENSIRAFAEAGESLRERAVVSAWVVTHPESARAQLANAELLEQAGRKFEAIEAYQRGLLLATYDEDPYGGIPDYRERLRRLRQAR